MFMLPLKALAVLVVRQILGSPEVKRRVFEALRSAAKDTTTKIDDGFVDMAEEAWSIAVPVVIGKAVK